MAGISVALGYPKEKKQKVEWLEKNKRGYLNNLNNTCPGEYYGTDLEVARVFINEFVDYLQLNLEEI